MSDMPKSSKILFVASAVFATIALFWCVNIPQKVSSSQSVANLEALIFCSTFMIAAVICFCFGIFNYAAETRSHRLDDDSISRLVTQLDNKQREQEEKTQPQEDAIEVRELPIVASNAVEQFKTGSITLTRSQKEVSAQLNLISKFGYKISYILADITFVDVFQTPVELNEICFFPDNIGHFVTANLPLAEHYPLFSSSVLAVKKFICNEELHDVTDSPVLPYTTSDYLVRLTDLPSIQAMTDYLSKIKSRIPDDSYNTVLNLLKRHTNYRIDEAVEALQKLIKEETAKANTDTPISSNPANAGSGRRRGRG